MTNLERVFYTTTEVPNAKRKTKWYNVKNEKNLVKLQQKKFKENIGDKLVKDGDYLRIKRKKNSQLRYFLFREPPLKGVENRWFKMFNVYTNEKKDEWYASVYKNNILKTLIENERGYQHLYILVLDPNKINVKKQRYDERDTIDFIDRNIQFNLDRIHDITNLIENYRIIKW